MTAHDLPRQAFLRGAVAILPLSLAVAPWGLLAGSMAIEANLTPAEGQGLSAIVFAGAAQLVAIGMLKGGAGFFSIIFTTLLLTSQHLLYGMSLRPVLSPLPGRWRIGLGFLLTDEFFVEALDGSADEPVGKRLGFLVQEMHREANTIGSKANDTEVGHASVAIKEEIERLREQIENVE